MDSNLTGQYIVFAIISIIISLVIHEFMHAYVGHLLGDTTAESEGRLTLNPLSHIDPFMTVILPIITIFTFGVPVLAAKPVPFNPDRVKYDEFGAALIAAAGPLTNLVLAIIGALIFRYSSGVGTMADFLSVFVTLNVALFVFNFIPIPPLDGSRVLYAFAPEPVQDVMRMIEPYGLMIIFALVLLGGFGGFLSNANQAILNLLP
ncbi:MAG TPA: site-2 protease family protein [Candidatus Saccharimonadales bacterium]|nr:site-2 protease family protein [Candidatus Saccharimonadales bacterium]